MDILQKIKNGERIGFDESLEVCEDYDFYLRLQKRADIELVDEKLITKYAGEANQLSRKHPHLHRYWIRSLEKLHTMYPEDESIAETLAQKRNELERIVQKEKMRYT